MLYTCCDNNVSACKYHNYFLECKLLVPCVIIWHMCKCHCDKSIKLHIQLRSSSTTIYTEVPLLL